MSHTVSHPRIAGLALLALMAAAAACALPRAAPPTALPPTDTAPPPTATAVPTDTPAPTATVPPTATLRPTNTSTPSPTPTPTPDWPVALFYDFEAQSPDWPDGTDSNEFGSVSAATQNGALRLEVDAAKPVTQRFWPSEAIQRDFMFTVDAQRTEGMSDASYGVLFRVAGGDSGYSFEVTDDGYYSVWRVEPDDWVPLIDWRRSTALNAGQPNRLAVIAQGTHFTFYANDQVIGQADDDYWPEGWAGVTVVMYEGGEQSTFEFDNFELRAPEEEAAAGALADAQAVAQATQQGQEMEAIVRSLADDGVLDSTAGAYYALRDFDRSEAKLDYYFPYPTGRSAADFVIRAEAAWDSASTTANWWNSGCGFVFRMNSDDDHYLAYLGLDGQAYMHKVLNGGYYRMGSSYYGKVDVPSGEASLMLAAQGSTFTFFVNGEPVHQRTDTSLRDGLLAYTLVSGTNKDYGTRCQMRDVELWVLE